MSDEPEYRGIRVTAEDIARETIADEQVIFHDYVLIEAGDCRVTYTQVSTAKDGSQTHVITVKGIRKGATQ